MYISYTRLQNAFTTYLIISEHLQFLVLMWFFVIYQFWTSIVFTGVIFFYCFVVYAIYTEDLFILVSHGAQCLTCGCNWTLYNDSSVLEWSGSKLHKYNLIVLTKDPSMYACTAVSGIQMCFHVKTKNCNLKLSSHLLYSVSRFPNMTKQPASAPLFCPPSLQMDNCPSFS